MIWEYMTVKSVWNKDKLKLLIS